MCPNKILGIRPHKGDMPLGKARDLAPPGTVTRFTRLLPLPHHRQNCHNPYTHGLFEVLSLMVCGLVCPQICPQPLEMDAEHSLSPFHHPTDDVCNIQKLAKIGTVM